MVVVVYGRHFNLGRATGLFHHDVLTFTMQVLALLCVATARVGVPGWTEFVYRHVISTWCVCLLVLRWVPRGPERGVSVPTGSGIPLRRFPFLRSLFSSGGLGVGRTCCAAQADRDLSETPLRHGRWSTTGGTSAGAWSVGQAARRGSFRDGRGRCAPLDVDGRVNSPCAKKCAHTPHAHTRRERTVHTRTTAHAAQHDTYTVICTCVACGAVAFCRHVNE